MLERPLTYLEQLDLMKPFFRELTAVRNNEKQPPQNIQWSVLLLPWKGLESPSVIIIIIKMNHLIYYSLELNNLHMDWRNYI